jgi:4-oxalocrotonate tautomerase
MPIANIQIIAGRDLAVKEALIRSVTTSIVEVLEVKSESVRVILHEIPSEHWGIGGVSAKELGR